MTVTMIAHKQGVFTGQGPMYAGDVRLAKLAIPKSTVDDATSTATLMSWGQLQNSNPLTGRRALDCHKGDFGHVLVVGGDHGFGGAVIMAAQAALRTGAGLVSVATQPEHVSALLARCPEVMAHGVTSGQALVPLLEKADAVVLGPGLGQGYWGQQLMQQVMTCKLPVIIDADALNLLAKGKIKHNLEQRLSILTPHPGEAGRLLGEETQLVQQDRYACVQRLHAKYHCAVVLKGLGTLVADLEGSIKICTNGSPGMATGGMGDVLSGILGALMVVSLKKSAKLSEKKQSKALWNLAIFSGVCLHSAAAELASTDGENSLVATDLLSALRTLIR